METPLFRTYAMSSPVSRHTNQSVRLLSDEEDDFEYTQQVRNHTVDPRYVLRRVDNTNKIDYSMCVDTDDEKSC
jgi:hypothetical protein